jgi:predicted anti-sigma-YlaC factor YlaD
MRRVSGHWGATCEETAEHLSAYLERDLERALRVRLSVHLRRCVRCRRLLASLRRTLEHLRSLRDARANGHPSVVPIVMERIRRERKG